jgi:excisionase family DNA binding protein
LVAQITKKFLSTGQAASLCSVTPDTVLKWIKSGRLPAQRTPGGHYRVPRDRLTELIASDEPATPAGVKRVQFCWEFHASTDQLPEGCRECLVYRSRARRCYEVSGLPEEAGHAKVFCDGSCEVCEYFRVVQGQKLSVMVVTNQEKLESTFSEEATDIDCNLRFSDCEYHCSMVIEKFRPDYIVIDCSLGRKRCRDLARHLERDPRIPFTRVVLVGEPKEIPGKCDKSIFAFAECPLSTERLRELLRSLRPAEPGAGA